MTGRLRLSVLLSALFLLACSDPDQPGAPCADACQLGETECADARLRACVAGEDGCLVWAEQACPSGACETPTECAPCLRCPAAGATRCAD
ncbi:MAG: hypothetical protein ACOX6T_10935, partial [Myxococcales bacterium]